jgi:O-antigen ligase
MFASSRLTIRMFALLFACQLFGFPLASVIPVFAGVDSKPISITYRVLIVSLTMVFVLRALRQGWALLKGPFATAALILAVLLLGRIAWDATMVSIPLDMPWADEWKYLFGVTVFPLMAFVVVPDAEGFEALRKAGVWIGSITFFFVIAAVVYTLRSATSLGGRLQTDILNPISLAHMALSCLILVNARAIAGIRRKSRSVGLLLGRWLMTLLCILAVIASISKGPILALFVIIGLAMLFRGRMDRSGRGLFTRLFFLVFAVSLGLGLLLLLDTYTPIQVVSRFQNAGSDASTSTRLDLIEGALAQFEESPWVGSSFVEYSSRFYPHNVIVEAMMTNGVLGLMAITTMLFGCCYSVGRILWNFPRERWIALLFVQYFIDSMFSGSLYFDATTWATTLMVLICVQAHSAHRRESHGLVAAQIRN